MAFVKNPFDLLKKDYEEARKSKPGEFQGPAILRKVPSTIGDVLVKKKIEFDERWKRKTSSNDSNIKLYEKLKTIGSGSFGRVLLVRHVKTKIYYAMKLMEKEKVLKQKQLDHTYNEKRLLQCVDHPFCVNMVECMKDNSFIYFVMPFVGGGEMFIHLRKSEQFSEELSKFYATQVLLGLEYLHYLDLVFRDLKPENIVIECDGYLRITDFGFCKMVKGRTWTLCGTPEYIAPEIILSKGYGKSVDWWSYGILVYEMNAGYPPFYSSDHMKLYEKIVSGKYKFPKHFSYDVKELIKNLLQTDLTRRYGNLKSGVDDIKRSPWFEGVDFMAVFNKEVEAPYVPTCKSGDDISNFSKCDREEPIMVAEGERYAKEFAEF